MQTSQSVPLFVLLTIALPWKVESQTPITCSAGQYKPGEKAYITCYYHGDISTEENNGLYITWYKLDAPKDSSGHEVLICHSKEGAVRVCNPEEGYRFVGINKDNLTIEVPDVSAEFQGRYSCGVVPGDGRVARPCILLVEGAYQLEKNTPRNPGTQGPLHEHVKTTHALMILTFILMTVAVAAIIYLTLAYRKRWFPFKRKDRIQHGDEERSMAPIDETDNGEQFSVGFRPGKPKSVNDPLLTSKGVPPGPVVELENSLPLKKDVDPQESHGGHAAAIKKEPAGENKAETKKERQERENQEEEDKKRKNKERKDDLEERLRKTSGEEKDRIQKEYDEMYARSHKAEPEKKKRMRKEYDELTKGLKNATTEEEKNRIQSEYDDQKEQWQKEKEQKKQKK